MIDITIVIVTFCVYRNTRLLYHGKYYHVVIANTSELLFNVTGKIKRTDVQFDRYRIDHIRTYNSENTVLFVIRNK